MSSWLRLLAIVLSGSVVVFVLNTTSDTSERMEREGDGSIHNGLIGSNSYQGANFLPDTTNFPFFGIPDSLKSSHSFSENKSDWTHLFKMPVFVPDSTLTGSMPILIPPLVDEGMIIPLN